MSVPDFSKGASGAANVYDTSPAGLGISPSYLASNSASASASGGGGSGSSVSYVEFQSPVLISATTAGTANTIVTADPITFDGTTAIFVQFSAPEIDCPAGATMKFQLYDGATDLGTVGGVSNPSGVVLVGISGGPMLRRLTPSAAQHTFSVRAFVSTGSGNVQAGSGGAGAFVPGFIRVM